MSDYATRFGGLGRLIGTAGLERLRASHVGVVGVGGVGSWAVEALARSGVGALTLVDLDDVCVTNVNRQLPALDGEFGQLKVDVLARRVRAINPGCVVNQVAQFFTPATASEILAPRFDAVLDAIDNVTNKALLIASCRERGFPIVTVGGAGGRRDPTRVRVADLAESSHDPLLQTVRRKLRAEFDFPRDPTASFGVDCVFSTELPVFPRADGSVCEEREAGSELKLDCQSGYGTASFVTGTFGFVAAGVVVRRIAEAGAR